MTFSPRDVQPHSFEDPNESVYHEDSQSLGGQDAFKMIEELTIQKYGIIDVMNIRIDKLKG